MSAQKELIVYSVGFLYKIKYQGGGEVPKILSGLYTSATIAKKAIEQYLTARDGDKDVADKVKRGSKQV